jgi:hypothetical protein
MLMAVIVNMLMVSPFSLCHCRATTCNDDNYSGCDVF